MSVSGIVFVLLGTLGQADSHDIDPIELLRCAFESEPAIENIRGEIWRDEIGALAYNFDASERIRFQIRDKFAHDLGLASEFRGETSRWRNVWNGVVLVARRFPLSRE